MNIAVRYYSRSGNTKILAEKIAEVAKVGAISVDADNADLNSCVDLLFIGGALYAYGLDKHLITYLDSLDKTKIKKALVFSTTWLSKHSIKLIKDKLNNKGIDVVEEYIYVRNKPSIKDLEKIEEIVKKYI